MPKNQKEPAKEDTGYIWSMSCAPKIDEDISAIQNIPLIFFTALVIMVMRMASFDLPLQQFYWALYNDVVDFFHYSKMIAIVICGAAVLLFIIYRIMTQTFAIKKTTLYIPIIVFAIFTILSYIFSDYKDFALLGFNERFEGTLVLLSYMLVLFYAINTVNTERNVKLILYPVAIVSGILGLLGISQATGYDFFKTKLGWIMITPKEVWDSMDMFAFRFVKGEIYQTVYNINYVAFYLTLLIPIFGLIFINSVMKGKQEKLVKKIIWGALFALLLFNMIGAKSSGGYLGTGIAVIAAILLLNKKLVLWWKPIALLLVITVIIGGVTYDRLLPELKSMFKGMGISVASQIPARDQANGVDGSKQKRSYIDYIELNSQLNMIEFSINGNEAGFYMHPESWPAFEIVDSDGGYIGLDIKDAETGEFYLDDERFNMCTVRGVVDENDYSYFVLSIDGHDWVFLIISQGTYYINEINKAAELGKVESFGFTNNPKFGSGRGYIWSRTFPMLKDTIFIGHGADTYCIYYPQNDYVGKYNMGWNLNMIIDKPHNMYMGMAVNTGCISLIAFLSILALYFIQSIKLYWRRNFDNFIEFAGFGIFLGILGFSATGLVDDSSVSVMPMFYGLLGTGIAVNLMIKRYRYVG